MSLYGLDQRSRKLLAVENFQGDFSAKFLIEQLSQNHAGAGALEEAIDPKPYIRTFEAALAEIRNLQTTLKRQEREMLTEVQNAEIKHSRNVIEVSRNLESVTGEFGVLDGLVGDIGAATSNLSDRLERMSFRQDQATSVMFLVDCYVSFVRDHKCPELTRLWTETAAAHDRRRYVNVVRQLQSLARRVAKDRYSEEDKNDAENENGFTNGSRSDYDNVNGKGRENNDMATAPGVQTALELIDKLAEDLERDLLADFNEAYQGNDQITMRHTADLLTEFNGGSSVVQIFVNQQAFFISEDKLTETSEIENSQEIWSQMGRLDATGEEDKQFDAVFRRLAEGEIYNVVAQETDTIRAVFRSPVMVLKVLLQRIFGQKIQQQLEAYLIAAESESLLAYVRALYTMHRRLNSLVKNLKELFARDNLDPTGELAAFLDQNFGDLFIPYTQNGHYYDSERRNLIEITQEVFARFTQAHQIRATAPTSREHTGFMSRFNATGGGNGVSGSGGGGSYTSSTSPNPSLPNAASKESPASAITDDKGRIGKIIRRAGLGRANSTEKHRSSVQDSGEDMDDVSEADFEIQHENVVRVLKLMSESVKRILELAPASELVQSAESMLSILLTHVGANYIDVALEDMTTQATLAAADTRTPETMALGFMQAIPKIGGAVQLVALFGKAVVLPMVSNSPPAIQKKLAGKLNAYIARVERLTNEVVQKTADAAHGRLEAILAKQRKKDFIPKEDHINGYSSTAVQTNAAVEATAVCAEIRGFLINLHGTASKSLDGDNLTAFLLEIGRGFKDLLLGHFRKFAVNKTGGRIVACDIQTYQTVIDRWNVEKLTEEFAIMHAIGNLYTAQPQVLGSLVRESSLSQLQLPQVREYLSKRVDYFTGNIDRLFRTSRTPKAYPSIY